MDSNYLQVPNNDNSGFNDAKNSYSKRLHKKSIGSCENLFSDRNSIYNENQSENASEKIKNILFCSISHELRSPINHINGILDVIKSYIDDMKLAHMIDIALSSSEMLVNKINDIMDYSLIETNTLELKPVEFNIRNLLAHIEDILNLQFDHKMINFSAFVTQNVPNIIMLDYKRLKQILLNLTYNALKYTERGFVSIIIECEFHDKYSNISTQLANYKGANE